MAELHKVLASNAYPHNADHQEEFIAEYVKKYQASEQYGGLERTVSAMVNASRGCSRSALESPGSKGSIAGFVMGIIDHQLLVLLRNQEAYKAFAKFLDKVRFAAPLVATQAHKRLERQLSRNPQFRSEDAVAVRALEQHVFSRAA